MITYETEQGVGMRGGDDWDYWFGVMVHRVGTVEKMPEVLATSPTVKAEPGTQRAGSPTQFGPAGVDGFQFGGDGGRALCGLGHDGATLLEKSRIS